MIRLLRELVPSSVLTLLTTEIVVIVSCFVLATYAVLDVDPAVYLLYDGGLGRILLVVATILLALYLHDLYTKIHVRSRLLLVQQVLQVMGIAFLAQALFSYSNPGLALPRWLMLLGSSLSFVAIVSWRIFYSRVVLRAIGETRVLFLGCNGLVLEIVGYLSAHPEAGMCPVGFVDDLPPGAPLPGRLQHLGGVSELREVVARVKPEEIIVGMLERRGSMPLMELMDLRFSGIGIQDAPSAFEDVLKRVPLNELHPAQLIYSRGLGPRPGSVALQAAYSQLLALASAIICAPLMLVVALAIKLSSRGPILYRQTRVGWQGRHFTLYKFRSMHQDAEAATGAVWAAKDDARVTPLGRWLRKLRLDELPQFFNVLRGEMSLVGPRPERPEFVDILAERIPFYRQRLSVRPGITGWAQINHKYGDTMEDAARKLEYDLYYIKHLSPSLDAYILFNTLKTVLLSRGAQ